MSASEWGQVAEELREKMVSIEIRANNVLVQLTGVCRTWESLKVDILEARLEEDRRLAAMAQGVRVLQRDQRKRSIPLRSVAAGLLRGAVVGKSVDSALYHSLAALNSSMEQVGASRWAVSLDRDMLVVPRDQIAAERFWVTWESLTEVLRRLRQKALDGKKLGNLAAIVSELKQDRQLRGCPVWLPDVGIPESGAE